MKSNHCSIFVISDVHEGHANSCDSELKKTVRAIKEISTEREVVTILNGDMIDSITINDKRFNPVEVNDKYLIRDLKDLPRKQADNLIELLKPIKDTIKFATVGNHEETYISYNHFDIYDYYCNELGCEKLGKFALGRIYVRPNKSSNSFTLNVGITHGAGGGGKSIAYPLTYTYDKFQNYNVDIGITGHIHKLIAHPESRFGLDSNMNAKEYTKWYCCAGCYLKTHVDGSTNYFEGKGGLLSHIGFIEIRIDRKHNGYKYKVVEHHL